jgi:putative two-component system response regulator
MPSSRDTIMPEADILLVDDERSNLVLLQHVLQKAGYRRIRSAANPPEALELIAQAMPDLVITDYRMPYKDGLSFITEVRATVAAAEFLPIILLTSDMNADLERRALTAGANDFLHKPVSSSQVQLRVSNLLHVRVMHQALQRQNASLAHHAQAARAELLERLALAAEVRDYATSRHTERVGQLSALLARKLGFSADEALLVQRAAILHDIGKLGVPDNILLKPGRLSGAEFEIMKAHTTIGMKLLANSDSELIRLAEQIAATHHERLDGSGYPFGLQGDEIPLAGQIVGLVDVFDALVSERPYKQAWPVEKVVVELRRLSGRWFAPRLVAAFLQVLADEGAFLYVQRPPAAPSLPEAQLLA